MTTSPAPQNSSPHNVIRYSLDKWRTVATQCFKQAGLAAANIPPTVAALLQAEIDGEHGHGFRRIPFYVAQLKSGKVSADSLVQIAHPTPIITAVDAGYGLAFPALEQAISASVSKAHKFGVAVITVKNSHHAGMMGYWAEMAAQQGLIGLFFTNSPAAIASWGGKKPLFGTNPIVCGFPRSRGFPIIVDLSLSKLARGKIMAAQQTATPIPAGIALDKAGVPTTDPAAALAGSLVPMGDARGYPLVLMVEIFAALLTGAHFSYEASSFFTASGAPPAIGQFAFLLDPAKFLNSNSSDSYDERLEALITTILDEPGTTARLPGSQKAARRKQAAENGIAISTELYQQLIASANSEQ